MGSLTGSNLGGIYSVGDLVGSGGMGTVYKGLHTRLGRPVAIKVLHSTQEDRMHSDSFLTEARLQASLRHPGIATLYDFADFSGQSCIVMEFIEGPTLAEHLQSRGPLSPANALSILALVCEAVRYLHEQEIVHCDLKPANIKLTPDGGVKLLDFGIARPVYSIPSKSGLVVGTFEYAAPECLAGKSADGRSDIWSLGVILYEMLTRRLPFSGAGLEELCRSVNSGRFTPASSYNKEVHRDIDSLISRCLQRDTADRFPNIDALQREISRCGNAPSAGLPRIPGLLKNLRKTGPKSSVPCKDQRVVSPAWWQAAVPFALFRNRWLLPVLAVMVLAFGLAFFLAPGVATSTGRANGDLKVIAVDVVNGPAEVFRDGRDLGTTPVSIDEARGSHVSLLLKRPGFADLPVDFDVDERSSYSYVLHEAASSR